ncbi:MAG: alpha-L-arabinofuranosidase C-terminal domain-containing protein [Paludibacter sp.]|nr:alpha-L-arabinofuranosidase C-terminal domain-containing protein [Paludibacter sp.]
MKTNLIILMLGITLSANAQSEKGIHGKKISPDLVGIFFEDINYSADGGLYGELVQNRSFEYSPSDRDNWHKNANWHSFTAWEYITEGFGYGNISIETQAPLHKSNPHYLVIDVQDTGKNGIGIKNSGYDGIPIKAGERYDFSIFLHPLSGNPFPVQVKLIGKKGQLLSETDLTTDSNDWKKYTATLTASQTEDSAKLVVLVKATGKIALDMVSLFPSATFKNRQNGLRADLAQTLADLKPKFIRFPGGCVVHGDGLANMYRWKYTIGPVEQRVTQRSLWNYSQSAGLGYFEYFQFCEDIGAKPLPVVAAAVSCQNSGGTWRNGSNGQKVIPQNEMADYIQEILDLIEWANGPETSVWGAKRAEAGHPKPFNLEYIGVGNEDKITPEFENRFKQIFEAVKAKHPEITIVGTVGPSPKGEDYENGWKLANKLNIPVVDEHFYEKAPWFIANQKRYDSYDRSASKVYIGEYASKSNSLFDAIAEAAFMTSLERNGDVVKFASYAPLLAKVGYTQWSPDMIYFNNTHICRTPNYYVQQLFSLNNGDFYYDNIVLFYDKEKKSQVSDSTLASSCVRDSKTGDVIIKLVNTTAKVYTAAIDLSKFNGISKNAVKYTLTGSPRDRNTFDEPDNIHPETATIKLNQTSNYELAPCSLTIFRIKKR